MARAADGTYTNPNVMTPNTLANATKVQENFDAIALALTDSLSRTGDGGLETDTSDRDNALSVGQAQDGKPTWCGTATGTTSAIVVTLTPVPTAIVAGMEVAFLMAADANAAAATLDIGITTGAPPVAVTYPIRRIDGTAIQAGDLAAGAMVTLRCDGTGFRVHSIVQGDVGQTLGTTVRTADATLGNADNAYVQDCTSAVTLTLDQASVLTAGWWSYVRNNSTSAVTLRGYRAADQATNGDFAGGTTGWTLGSGWSVSTAAVATAASAAISQAQTLTVGALYEVAYTVTASAGTVTPQLTGGTTVSGTARSTAGTYTDYLRAVTGNVTIGFLGAAFTGGLDNISVRKVEEIDGVATKTIVPGAMQLVWCDGATSRLSPATGPGNATVTSGATSITLTASSARVQSVTMTAAAQSVTLPDATTLTLGGPLYVIHNAGDRPFGVRSNGGALLAVVAAGGVADCYLESTATAAGQWAVNGRGLEPALTLVDATLPSTYTTAFEVACKLTDTLSIHFAGATPAVGLFAVAVDSTPGAGSIGTPAAIDATSTPSPSHCFRISDTQAIVFWINGANHKCAVLTVSGTTVSVGTVASTTNAFLSDATFTGRPLIAQLTTALYVVQYTNGSSTIQALAVSVSGTTATIGTPVAAYNTGTGGLAVLACYSVSATTALSLYIDDSGTAGTPFSIRGVVLSVSGTTITAGTSAGVNDVTTSVLLSSCQLSATSHIVAFLDVTNSDVSAVQVGVSGTTVTFGTKFAVDVGTFGTNPTYITANASRFQPNLYPLTTTTALFTWGEAGSVSRHAVLTNTGGTLSVGAALYSLWDSANGGNFPQTPSGFLAYSSAVTESCVFSVTISGTTLSVTGTFGRGDVSIAGNAGRVFGLSGGVCGYAQSDSTTTTAYRPGVYNLFRFRANASPQYLGPMMLNNYTSSTKVPVEIASNKAAFISSSLTQSDATFSYVKLLIVEFAA